MRRHGCGGPHSQRIAFFVAAVDPARFKAASISSCKGPRLSELRLPAGKPANGRKILASNIRRYCLQHGWSQEALAARAGIHRTYLGSVERGERNVAIDNICRIAWALGVHACDLLKD